MIGLLLGIDHRQSGRQEVAAVGVELDRVVIGDDHVQAERVSVRHLDRRADAAVHSNDQPCACRGDPVQRVVVETVAFIHAVGDVGADVRAERGQTPGPAKR